MLAVPWAAAAALAAASALVFASAAGFWISAKAAAVSFPTVRLPAPMRSASIMPVVIFPASILAIFALLMAALAIKALVMDNSARALVPNCLSVHALPFQ